MSPDDHLLAFTLSLHINATIPFLLNPKGLAANFTDFQYVVNDAQCISDSQATDNSSAKVTAVDAQTVTTAAQENMDGPSTTR